MPEWTENKLAGLPGHGAYHVRSGFGGQSQATNAVIIIPKAHFRMRFNIHTFTSTLLIAAISAISTSCSSPESDYKKAEQANTEKAYSEFIAKHPDSPLVAQAKAKIEQTAYEAALKTGTVPAFEGFLKRFSSGSHAEKAKGDMDALEFILASKSSTIPLWQTYITKYPQSTNAPMARSSLAELLLPQVVNTNTVLAYNKFAKEFSGTAAATQALQKASAIIRARSEANKNVNIFSGSRYELNGVTLGANGKQRLTKDSKIVNGMFAAGLSVDGPDQVSFKLGKLRFVRGIPVVECEGGFEYTVLLSGDMKLTAIVIDLEKVRALSLPALVAEFKKKPSLSTLYQIQEVKITMEIDDLADKFDQMNFKEQEKILEMAETVIHPALDNLLEKIQNDPTNPNSGKAKAIFEK